MTETPPVRSLKPQTAEFPTAFNGYLVRRVAGRAFARIDQPRFRQLFSRWMNAGNTEFCVRYAENAQWLPIDDQSAISNPLIQSPGPNNISMWIANAAAFERTGDASRVTIAHASAYQRAGLNEALQHL